MSGPEINVVLHIRGGMPTVAYHDWDGGQEIKLIVVDADVDGSGPEDIHLLAPDADEPRDPEEVLIYDAPCLLDADHVGRVHAAVGWGY